jgi:methionine biosynthesis protein MetW
MPSSLPGIYQWIVERAPTGGRVLDLGCGEGDLLARLVAEKNVKATGVELSEASVMKAIQRGLSVHHGNIEEGLDHYSDQSCDLVVLSLTIQELADPLKVLREAFRVGRQVIIVFPNFGHWKARWQLGVRGKAPNTPSLPYTWYTSPNRHYLTVSDWEEFCRQETWVIADKGFLSGGKMVGCLPNLRAEVAMYLLQQPQIP